jgi:hypothetical protein
MCRGYFEVTDRRIIPYAGTAECQAMFADPEPPIPFGDQTRQNSLIIEDGFKASYKLVMCLQNVPDPLRAERSGRSH